MRFCIVACVALSATLVSFTSTASAAPYIQVAPSDLLNKPSFYDGQHVAVTGRVQNIQEKTMANSVYDNFELCDQRCVRIVALGRPAISEGQRVTVHGTFNTVKGPPGIGFRSEIDASFVLTDSYGDL